VISKNTILCGGRRRFSASRFSESGFTLLEVLVGLAVLAVGAALTMSLISGSLGNIRKVQLRTRTIEHAEAVMELALLDDSIERPTTFRGDFEDGTRWSVRVEEYVPPDAQTQPSTVQPQRLAVQLFSYTVEVISPDSRAPDYRLQTLKLVKTPSELKPAR
jgi:prepilin-type N-terminal cleavage/methylation domain-containing protein